MIQPGVTLSQSRHNPNVTEDTMMVVFQALTESLNPSSGASLILVQNYRDSTMMEARYGFSFMMPAAEQNMIVPILTRTARLVNGV